MGINTDAYRKIYRKIIKEQFPPNLKSKHPLVPLLDLTKVNYIQEEPINWEDEETEKR